METRKIRVKIDIYGKAPAKYGPDAYKVGLVERVLLVRAGWTRAGSGRGYEYVRSHEGKAQKKVVIEVEVPTDQEILQLAMAMHSRRESQVDNVGGFIVQYRPSGHLMYTYQQTGAIYADGAIEPPGEKQEARTREAEFEFGVDAPYSVKLTWSNGDDAEPTWRRFERGVEP